MGELFNRMDGHIGFSLGRSKYQVLDAEEALVWTPDYIRTYGTNVDISWERGGFLKEIGIEGGWEKRGVYIDQEEWSAVAPGSETTIEGQIVLRPKSFLEWSVEGGWVRQAVDGAAGALFDGITYQTALHYQLTRNLFLNARLFGETIEKQYSLDLLVGYYFGAGNIVQLALKKNERNDLFGRLSGYSATLKVSYLLRI